MKLLLTVFWRGTKECRGLLSVLFPLMVALAGLWFAEPLYARYAIDTALTALDGGDVDLKRLFLLWLSIHLVINLVSAFVFYFRWTIENRLLTATRQIYYEHLLKLDISHHVQAHGGELMKKIDNAADAFVDLTRQVLFEIPTATLTAIAFFVVSFFISWQLALTAALFVPAYLLIAAFVLLLTRKRAKEINQLYVRSMGRGYDAITNIFTVKSSAGEARELSRMESLHHRAIREWDRINIIWSFFEGINYFMFLRLLLVSAGFYLLLQGELTLGSLFFFQFSFFRLIIPLQLVQGVLHQWNEKIDKIQLAEDLYHKDILVQNPQNPQTIEDFKGSVTFDNISFSYGDVDAVKDIMLEVKAGEHIAFVGHSGAGKSTMAMLINRFYDVSKGSIRIDEIDIKDLDIHWWRSQVGLVLQDNVMFNDSIINNIRYSHPDATKEEVIDATTRASAHSFIESLSEGYETMIGERGIRLSGGERQRVAIARAILKKPKIIVLDEATSALDSITEKEVQEGIKELIEDKTSFIIAHRLSTVQSVDRIVVLDKGKVIACAPHKELMETCDVYKKMVELQSGGLLAE